MKRNLIFRILLCLLLPLQLLAVEGVADTSKVKKSTFWNNKELGVMGSLGVGYSPIIGNDYRSDFQYEFSIESLRLISQDYFLRFPISDHWNLRFSVVTDYYTTKFKETRTANNYSVIPRYYETVTGTLSTITLNPGIGFENFFEIFDEGAAIYFIYGLEFPMHLLALASYRQRQTQYWKSDMPQYSIPSESIASFGGVINYGFGSYFPVSEKLKINLELGLKADLISRFKNISGIDNSGSRDRIANYYSTYISAGLTYKLGDPMAKSKVDPKIYYYRDNSKGVYEYRKAKPVTPSPVFGEDNVADGKFDTLSLPEVKKVKSTAKRDAKIAAAIEGTVAILRPDQGHGSGFLISEDGYLITNAHVVDTFKTVKIKLYNNLVLDAKVVRMSTKHDLALVKIEGAGFKPLFIGSTDSTNIGSDVFIIGSPFDTQLSSTVTKGILSSKRTYNEIKLIQTDAAINGGNSGGPLVNENGEVIGIAFSKIKMTGVEGLGFCVAADEVREALKVVQGKK